MQVVRWVNPSFRKGTRHRLLPIVPAARVRCRPGLSTISGLIPAGSPMVSAMVGRALTEELRHGDEGIVVAESSPTGDDGSGHRSGRTARCPVEFRAGLLPVDRCAEAQPRGRRPRRYRRRRGRERRNRGGSRAQDDAAGSASRRRAICCRVGGMIGTNTERETTGRRYDRQARCAAPDCLDKAAANPPEPAQRMRRGLPVPAATMASRSASFDASTETTSAPACERFGYCAGIAHPTGEIGPLPRSWRRPTRRPMAGNAGVAMAASHSKACNAAAISAPGWPRRSESIFLKMTCAVNQSASCATSAEAADSSR